MKPLSFIKFPPCAAVALGLGVALLPPARAQNVYKCTDAGKTVYQSSPCAGQGKELEIKAGPSEQEIAEARRAWENKSGPAASQAPAYQPRPQIQPAARPVDCAKLNKERADAFGRRNAANYFSRKTNKDDSAAVNRSHEDIRRIERQMVQGGCKPS